MEVFEFIYGIVAVALVSVLFIGFFKRQKKYGLEKNSAFASVFWLSIFIFTVVSTAVYSIGQFPEDYTFANVLGAVADSLGSGFRIFAFDFIKQSTIIKEAWLNGIGGKIYSIAVFLVWLCAGLWTYYMVIVTFFRGATNEIKVFMHKNGVLFKNGSTHYIIVGCGAQAEKLLNNIDKTQKTSALGDYVTIIPGESTKNRNAEDFYKKYLNSSHAVILGKADSKALLKAGVNNLKRKTVVIAMTESDEENIAIADILTGIIVDRLKIIRNEKDKSTDAFLKEISDIIDGKNADKKNGLVDDLAKIRLEARISYNFIDRTEHFRFVENAFGKIRFFNIHEMRAKAFFAEHPVTDFISEYIDVEKGRLKGKFDANGKILKSGSGDKKGEEYLIKNIFLGFGATNYEMLKSSLINGQILGADYYADIYTNDSLGNKPSVRQATFMRRAQGFFGGLEPIEGLNYFESPKEKYNVKFHYSEVLSSQFYDDIYDNVKENDYTAIFIALGNDKKNVETALELRQMLSSKNIFCKKVSIFVKTGAKSGLISDDILNSYKDIPIKIECYGQDDELLTAEEITAPSLNELADKISNRSHNLQLDLMPEFERESNRCRILYLNTALGFLGLSLKTGGNAVAADDVYNARYFSKDIGGKTDGNTNGLKVLFSSAEEIKDNARNNLARLEHLRWVTFYIANGWTKKPKEYVGGINGGDKNSFFIDDEYDEEKRREYMGRKNLLKKQHACITTFDGLIELRKWQYDALSYRGKEGKISAVTTSESQTINTIKEEDYDTIRYDFDLMDNLLERIRENTDLTVVDVFTQRKNDRKTKTVKKSTVNV